MPDESGKDELPINPQDTEGGKLPESANPEPAAPDGESLTTGQEPPTGAEGGVSGVQETPPPGQEPPEKVSGEVGPTHVVVDNEEAIPVKLQQDAGQTIKVEVIKPPRKRRTTQKESEPKKKEPEEPPISLRTRIERLALAALSVDEILETLDGAKKHVDYVRGVVDKAKSDYDDIKEKHEQKIRPQGEREKREDWIKQRVYRRLLSTRGERGEEIADRIIHDREFKEDTSLFSLIQTELEKLQDDPDPKLEKSLIESLSVLIKYARNPEDSKDTLWAGLKDKIADDQHAIGTESWDVVKDTINRIDTGEKEEAATKSGLLWWSRDFGGMLDKYKLTAIDHMDRAYIRAQLEELRKAGKLNTSDGKRLQAEYDFLDRRLQLQPWSSDVPADLRSIARDALDYEENLKKGPAERVDLTREELLNKDFVPKNDAEMEAYQEAVKQTIYESLDSKKDGLADDLQDQWQEIVDSIKDEKDAEPEVASLFDLLAEKREDLWQQALQEISGKDEAETRIILESKYKPLLLQLRDVVSVLGGVAENAGILDDVRKRVAANQENDDFEAALDTSKRLIAGVDDLDRRATTKTLPGRKYSVDFGGINQAYAEGAHGWMDLGMMLAQIQLASEDPNADPQVIANMNFAAYVRKEMLLAETVWGNENRETEFKNKAYQWLTVGKPDKDAKKSGVRNLREEALLERIARAQEAAARRAEQQVDLLRQGIDGVFQVESQRAFLNPQQFDQLFPAWFKELSETEQNIIRTELNINYFAALKRNTGMTNLDPWANREGIRVEVEHLKQMWDGYTHHDVLFYHDGNFADGTSRKGHAITEDGTKEGRAIAEFNLDRGFRVALTSMVNKFFILNGDHLVLKDGKNDEFNAIEVLDNHEALEAFQRNLDDALVEYLRPKEDELKARYNVDDIRQIARGSRAIAESMLFSFGAFDSGDEGRKLHSPNVISDTVRTFMMPRVKGESKWRQGVPSDFGGPLGEWYQWNWAHNKRFREDCENDKIKIIPKRMFYSLFDHAYMQHDGRAMSLAQAMMMEAHKGSDYTRIANENIKNKLGQSSGEDEDVKDVRGYQVSDGKGGFKHINVDVGVTLHDFGDSINIKHIGKDEVLGSIADFQSDAIAIYNHIVGKDAKRDRISAGKFVSSRNKLMSEAVGGGDQKLINIYHDDQLTKGAIIMMASPERGLVRGTRDMILDVSGLYDVPLNNAMDDERLFSVKRGLRKELIRELHGHDLETWGGTFGSLFSYTFSFFTEREEIIRRAKKKRRKVILDEDIPEYQT